MTRDEHRNDDDFEFSQAPGWPSLGLALSGHRGSNLQGFRGGCADFGRFDRVYWFRASMGITGWDGFGFGTLITLGWWLPAVAFAVLYRHPGERWLAQGRGRFLARVLVAVVASLAGLPIQGVLQEQQALLSYQCRQGS